MPEPMTLGRFEAIRAFDPDTATVQETRDVITDLVNEILRRDAERPSRFRTNPAQIDAFLRKHLAEDQILLYQWAIGDAVLAEASDDLREDHKNDAGGSGVWDWSTAADSIDPRKDGFRLPSKMVDFGKN